MQARPQSRAARGIERHVAVDQNGIESDEDIADHAQQTRQLAPVKLPGFVRFDRVDARHHDLSGMLRRPSIERDASGESRPVAAIVHVDAREHSVRRVGLESYRVRRR